MLWIQKNRPPDCIEVLQKTDGADWSSVHSDQKEEMRQALLQEQGYLCAYCMSRVANNTTTTVEHWQPRSDIGTDPFHWPDLLAVCPGGGAGASPDQQHCDRSRGAASLTVHPAKPGLEQKVRYDADGTIYLDGKSENPLNLNFKLIKQNRAAIVEFIRQQATDIATTRRLIAHYQGRDGDNQRRPYAGIALYFLERRFNQLEGQSQRMRQNRVR
jgi:uncharacterized protein (TIGR02646 family)